ncbi:hypothetical protein [Mangrovimonas sp. DI 80]|uniref:hypothetical protein n=1 Tax=Mangrovimonas sp. DI 80 TaxID=1779330 RepID=UPI0009763F7F|nr:hypothetical protein [Mangrovimonas sp. DI 80]OMP31175.1 hypothetical protein BKM32_08940 [Mangrovimonas sp. DI 80]
MAKLRSIIKIEGTLDDLTFYKGKQGYLVKTKRGVIKNRIQSDPAFARTRENGAEFGNAASAGKLLRRAILDLLVDAKDGLVTSRLTQVMAKVKNADTTSLRGARNVALGLQTVQGQTDLKGFDFNANALLGVVLRSDFTLNTTTGEVSITNFIPSQNLDLPEGATHVSFISGVLNIDFETRIKELQLSPVTNMPIDGLATSVTLTPSAVPSGSGNQCFFLKVAFYQEVNAVQYPLNNGAFNALQLIDIV